MSTQRTLRIGNLLLAQLPNGAVEITHEKRDWSRPGTNKHGRVETEEKIGRMEASQVAKLREFLTGGVHA